METISRANLRNPNDVKGMLLEMATVEALKSIHLYVERHSQFNEFYQEDQNTGPDITFEFGGGKTGCIECKNLNMNFKVSEDWFKNSVESRFNPTYDGLDLYLLVTSIFKPSPLELSAKIRKRLREKFRKFYIIQIGFQVTDDETYYNAIPIIKKYLSMVLNG